MTAKELIDLLKEMPSDAVVCQSEEAWGVTTQVASVVLSHHVGSVPIVYLSSLPNVVIKRG